MGTPTARTDGPRLDGWFVTARQRQPGPYGEPRPWGAVHVKRIGEPKTACGVVCLGWQVFWRMSVESVLPEVCEECRAAALAEARGSLPRCNAC